MKTSKRRVVRRLADAFPTIDISRKKDVLALVHEVLESGRPRILRRGNEALVLVTPYTAEAQARRDVRGALERAAGSWPADEADRLRRDIAASRAEPPAPAVKL